ncbi:MAG: hypothetical protein LBF90_00480, partial [Prevotellaceae bacterium]|nr:hypothetical protein [Prevotellaceae bacterium]
RRHDWLRRASRIAGLYLNLISTLFKKQNNLSSTGRSPSPEPYYLISMNNEQLACGGDAGHDAQWNVGRRLSISIENYHPRHPSTRRVECE